MIAGDVIHGNAAVDGFHNPPVSFYLMRVAGLVDKIAADYDKCGPQAIDIPDDEIEIRFFLQRIRIVRIHAELGVGHLHEELRLLGKQ
jgi:hypothetical protein